MLTNDRQITISAAGSRKATKWLPQTLFVSEFYDRLKTVVRSTETLAEYLKLPKSKQDELKDVGGFVAGTLQNNTRKANCVIGRDILTLDLDNIPPGGTNEIIRRVDGLGCSYVIYSTRKHEESKPRLRVLIPTNRTVTADEYEPIARKVASLIGIEFCDPTTFEASRLMYNPSCCRDSNYIYTFGDKPFVDADRVLSMYLDWHNISEWPKVPGEQDKHYSKISKQVDPTVKGGVVGAFCRIYDVYKAMEIFLPGLYEPCDDNSGRFTYSGGSTVGGAIIYDNGNFIYSHHATDPAGGKLCNAFDFVRLHKYGELDNDATPGTLAFNLPSYKAMNAFAISDTYVSALISQERYEKATQNFEKLPEDTANWIGKLQVNATTGLPAKTIENVTIILENDPLLKGKIVYDEFGNRGLVLGDLPWNKKLERRQWTDVDDSGLRGYLEKVYMLTGKDRINDGLTNAAHKNVIHEVKTYLTVLKWDNVKRLDTLFIDYLGANDTTYVRAVTRKSFIAAVARIMTPGIKYDTMLILGGEQGLGKSTLLKIMAKNWFSESMQTFEGKEASEMIQGVWIVEIAELNGLNKSEINTIKQFLSRTEDIYREPYGRRTKPYPRQCVFFGTTNETEYLKDITGNRRFWPIDVGVQPAIKSVWEQLPEEVDQIWAEAFLYWQIGEKLYLTGEAEAEALKQQEAHRETDAREGIIKDFVVRQVPLNWDKRSLGERRLYWSGEFGKGTCETIERDRICAAEVWCECFNGDLKYMKRTDAIFINNVLSKIPGWKRYHGRFGQYGQQKGFTKG